MKRAPLSRGEVLSLLLAFLYLVAIVVHQSVSGGLVEDSILSGNITDSATPIIESGPEKGAGEYKEASLLRLRI